MLIMLWSVVFKIIVVAVLKLKKVAVVAACWLACFLMNSMSSYSIIPHYRLERINYVDGLFFNILLCIVCFLFCVILGLPLPVHACLLLPS